MQDFQLQTQVFKGNVGIYVSVYAVMADSAFVTPV